MTRKQFIALAKMVVDSYPGELKNENATGMDKSMHLGRLAQWCNMRDDLVRFCAEYGPRFDRDKWLDYVGERTLYKKKGENE